MDVSIFDVSDRSDPLLLRETTLEGYSLDARRIKYRFTRKGMDIYTITLALMQWGDRYLADDDGPPLTLYHKTCGQRLEPVMRCAQCGEAINARDIIFEDGLAITNSS